MKKIITLSISLILTAFIFSSCNQSLSLTKRHYNKGYYVNTKKSVKTEKSNSEQKNITIINTEKVEEEVFNPIVINDVTIDSSFVNNYKEETIINKDKVAQANTHSKKIKFEGKIESNGLFQASKSNSLVSEIQKESKKSSDDDSLSLFWIIIFIILLLWVFGFVFLANALIHLLLLVALILLILWLLRII